MDHVPTHLDDGGRVTRTGMTEFPVLSLQFCAFVGGRVSLRLTAGAPGTGSTLQRDSPI